MRRFYAPRGNFSEDKIHLNFGETRHLRNVLRLNIGEKICVFDGQGKEFLCEILEIRKKETKLKIIEEISPKSAESKLDLTLAVALLKGEKFDLVIQKAVELGVTKFVPLLTKNCDVKVKNIEKKIERWRRIVIESSKQCGRAKLMQVIEPKAFTVWIENFEGEGVLFLEKDGGRFSDLKMHEKITAFIGSEGGWDDSEIEIAYKKGIKIITFGGRILRAETAAISITAVLQHNFGDFN